eukprot:145952-Pleurochrysis_carterae.AAC.1
MTALTRRRCDALDTVDGLPMQVDADSAATPIPATAASPGRAEHDESTHCSQNTSAKASSSANGALPRSADAACLDNLEATMASKENIDTPDQVHFGPTDPALSAFSEELTQLMHAAEKARERGMFSTPAVKSVAALPASSVTLPTVAHSSAFITTAASSAIVALVPAAACSAAVASTFTFHAISPGESRTSWQP